MNDDPAIVAARLYTVLHWQLAGQIPRPGGIHIYSKGATYSKMSTTKNNGVWTIRLSPGVKYSAFEFGYGVSGQRLTPRIPKPTKSNPNPKPLEARNFQIIPQTMARVARLFAIPSGGKVVIK